MPKTAQLFYDHIKKLIIKDILEETKSLNKKVSELKEELTLYKKEKHYIEGENLNLKQVIKSNDEETMEELRKIWEKDEKK